MLKLIGGFYLSLISGSVTASAFGGAVGILVWINLVVRFAFFTAAWTASLRSGVAGRSEAGPPPRCRRGAHAPAAGRPGSPPR